MHYKTIITHLNQDPILAAVIKYNELEINKPNQKVYSALLRTIISQQLSVKAADTIYKRFTAFYKTHEPEKRKLLDTDTDKLRGLGLSRQKAQYVKNVAQFFNDHKIDSFANYTDAEVLDLLIQIKGVGEWTVQMILIFKLERLDVFPVKDLVIQKQMKKHYGIKAEKKELIEKLQNIALKWSPYRSVASRYLWAAENSNG